MWLRVRLCVRRLPSFIRSPSPFIQTQNQPVIPFRDRKTMALSKAYALFLG